MSNATGVAISGSASIGSSSEASDGPSISTAAGCRSSSACTSRRRIPARGGGCRNRNTLARHGLRSGRSMPRSSRRSRAASSARFRDIPPSTALSCTGSFTTAPTMLAASVSGVSLPSSKNAAWLMPADHRRDRLGGRQRARGRSSASPCRRRSSPTQLAEDGHAPAPSRRRRSSAPAGRGPPPSRRRA